MVDDVAPERLVCPKRCSCVRMADFENLDPVAGRCGQCLAPFLDRGSPCFVVLADVGRSHERDIGVALGVPIARANEPNTMIDSGERLAQWPSMPSFRLSSPWRNRALGGERPRRMRTSRNNADGGTSRRSTMPSSAKSGMTREAWAMLTSASSARVWRFSSASVRARTPSNLPRVPGITAPIGGRKSTPPATISLTYGAVVAFVSCEGTRSRGAARELVPCTLRI